MGFDRLYWRMTSEGAMWGTPIRLAKTLRDGIVNATRLCHELFP
jgi:hypothetical protein